MEKAKAMMRTLAVAVLALTATPDALQAQHRVDEKRAAASDGIVEIENAAGSIRVVGWSRAEVAVAGTLGNRAEGLRFTGGAKRTRIEVETHGNPHGVSSDLEIHVPAESRVQVTSFGASIAVSDVTGGVTAESVNSSIVVTGAAKEVSVETVNGSVEVSGPAARVHAGSVNGAVTVKGVKGVVEANTVNGRLSVAGATFERGTFETVNGSLRFEGALARQAEVSAQTVSGSVEFVLPPNVSASFTITTFSGDVQNDFGQTPTRARYTSQKELHFSAGDGDAKVSIQTLSGSIHLRKRQ
jgi:DUF4097 and DUF4098 domain-containing protein YvlB